MKRLVFVLTLTIAVCAPAHAAETGEDTAAGQAGSVAESLDRIGRTLEALVRLQKIEVLLMRVTVEEQRLTPRGTELRQTRDQNRNRVEQIEQMKAARDEIESHISEATRTGADVETSYMREEVTQLDRMIQVHELQFEETERRVQELENDLSRARRTMDILDEKLTEAFEQLGL